MTGSTLYMYATNRDRHIQVHYTIFNTMKAVTEGSQMTWPGWPAAQMSPGALGRV